MIIATFKTLYRVEIDRLIVKLFRETSLDGEEIRKQISIQTAVDAAYKAYKKLNEATLRNGWKNCLEYVNWDEIPHKCEGYIFEAIQMEKKSLIEKTGGTKPKMVPQERIWDETLQAWKVQECIKHEESWKREIREEEVYENELGELDVDEFMDSIEEERGHGKRRRKRKRS